MPESPLKDLLQQTFDAVNAMRNDLTTALNRQEAHNERLTKVETQLATLAEAHTATRLEVVALKAGRATLGGASALGGGGLGYALQALLGGLVLACVVGGCAGAAQPLRITRVSGHCDARVSFAVAGQPAHFDFVGEGTPPVGAHEARLVGMLRLWVGGLYAECKGTLDAPAPDCHTGIDPDLGDAPHGASF